MALLGLSETLPPAKQSALLLPPLLIPSPPAFPTSLYPTSLQLCVVYYPRIAIVPCATMRNNLILFSGAYDMEALATDLHGGLFERFRDADMSGVMIWGELWRSASWEVTDGFARKWGFLLEGCPDIQDATNQWRESRGEEPICWATIPTLERSKTQALTVESCSWLRGQ
ncbi:unnamed protein product [Clonostachys rhizophaga]|uniref:Uncharacterized protein n=1 Tax=Clonostachys rhizophaga TaxID=160324 RepID=A0A9N9VDY2_9HYPO|nr:unnamed protein product [Clonostachys rhizophaga]